MPTSPKVAVIYLAYHSQQHLPDALAAWKKLVYPRDAVELVIVDNPHAELGNTRDFVEAEILPLSGKELPHVTYLPQETNLGFAGGNNLGMQWAVAHNFQYVYLHNDDGYMAPDVLDRLVEVMEADQRIGQAQALVMLHPETELVNSAGNRFHYLGFGYCEHYRDRADALHLPRVKDVGYASGAATMLRTSLLQKLGFWDHDFFMYHEDLEYSFRLRAAGYRVVIVPVARFYHKYKFSKSISKYFWMERNRFGVLLMFFRWPTLLLLTPMLTALELGLLVFAWRGGWLGERVKVLKYWASPKNWPMWLEKRHRIQGLRRVPDRAFLKNASAKIEYQEVGLQHPLIKYLANPVMIAYLALLRLVVHW